MKIENNLAVIMEQVKEDILHARKNIKNLYERDVEVEHEFSSIPSDKEYRIFISVKAKEKPILDEAEKEYLKAVIKPFRKRLVGIMKSKQVLEDGEFIMVRVQNIDGGIVDIIFPLFEKNRMYKGMEVGRCYSLKELGLEERKND